MKTSGYLKIVFSLATIHALSSGPLQAQWLPSEGGVYSYHDLEHWQDGVINGAFASTLTGHQTITVNADTRLADVSSPLNFSYSGNYNVTLQSDSQTPRVLSFEPSKAWSLLTSNGTAARTVTIGTIENPLILDLGTANVTRSIYPGSYTSLVLNAQITGGNGNGKLAIRTASANPGSVTLANDSNDFVSNLSIGIARNLRITSVADAGVASAIGAGSIIYFENGNSYTALEYIGGTGSTNRTVMMGTTGPAGDMRIINNGTGALTFTGDFIRTPGTADVDSVLSFWGKQQIEITGNIEDSTGDSSLTVVKVASSDNTLTLSGDNSFTGGIEVRNGLVEFTSIANTGVDSALGNAGTVGLGYFGTTGTIRYTGTADSSTNRTLKFAGTTGGGVIKNDGTGALVFNGAIEMNSEGNKTVALGGSNEKDNTITGTITDGAAGATTLLKTDDGKWVLTGDNTYTGLTRVNGGILAIEGDQSDASGAVMVASSAMLAGSGKIGGLVSLAAGASLNSGTNGGSLELRNGLTLNAAGDSLLDLGVGALEQPSLLISGGAFIGNSSGVTTINLFAIDGFVETETYTLIDWSGAAAQDIDLSHFALGTQLDGLLAELRIREERLEVTFSAIPEPSSTALALGAMGLFATFAIGVPAARKSLSLKQQQFEISGASVKSDRRSESK